MDITKGYGARIRTLRKTRGMSGYDMAKAVGITNAVFYRYEREETKPRIRRLKKIAEVLETTPEYLAGSAGPKVPPPTPAAYDDKLHLAYLTCRQFLSKEQDKKDLESVLLQFLSDRVQKNNGTKK